MQYDIIIGLEIHVQLATSSKMFCSCDSKYFDQEPNSHTCPICLGMPGTLPLPNKKALESTILLGFATHCKIDNKIKFDRKHYFYPDLPKGYQISQYDEPICKDGYVTILSESGERVKIEIERIHQEEDVAKTFHKKDDLGQDYTLIDYNKSGIPLAEIVTKPIIKSPYEARAFATRIRQIVRYFGISDADMEKGQMRCEPNISVQKKGTWEYKDGKILPIGDAKLNPKVEIKNIGSISAVQKALEYEIDRITKQIEAKEKLIQHTRGWNAQKGLTEFQRSKESAPDYGYFPEPDIPIIDIDEKTLVKIKSRLKELPEDKEERFINDYGLSLYDTGVLTADRTTSEIFEDFVSKANSIIKGDIKKTAKLCANWTTGVIFGYANDMKKDLASLNLDWEQIAKLLFALENGTLTSSKAKEVLLSYLGGKLNINNFLQELSKSESIDLKSVIKQIIKENNSAVTDYKNGKQQAIGFLIGKCMQQLKGMGNPSEITKLLKEELDAS